MITTGGMIGMFIWAIGLFILISIETDENNIEILHIELFGVNIAIIGMMIHYISTIMYIEKSAYIVVGLVFETFLMMLLFTVKYYKTNLIIKLENEDNEDIEEI